MRGGIKTGAAAAAARAEPSSYDNHVAASPSSSPSSSPSLKPSPPKRRPTRHPTASTGSSREARQQQQQQQQESNHVVSLSPSSSSSPSPTNNRQRQPFGRGSIREARRQQKQPYFGGGASRNFPLLFILCGAMLVMTTYWITVGHIQIVRASDDEESYATWYNQPQHDDVTKMAAAAAGKASGRTSKQQQSQPSYYVKKPAPKMELKIPTPIFVLNLPKSGTSSLDKFFKCGLGYHWSTHAYLRNQTNHLLRIGTCMGQNVRNDRPLVEWCGDYHVYADAGAIWDEVEYEYGDADDPTAGRGRKVKHCFYPGVHGLENIAKHYPEATVVHIPRNVSTWLESARGWNNLLGRLSANCDGFPRQKSPLDKTATDKQWIDFHEGYTRSIRDFARSNPSLTYIEAKLEDPDLAEFLQDATGVPSTCWGHHHKTSEVKKRNERLQAQKEKRKHTAQKEKRKHTTRKKKRRRKVAR